MITDNLKMAIDHNRLAHAMLFIGENTEQKEAAAFELADFLNCDAFQVQIIESEASAAKRSNAPSGNDVSLSSDIKIEAIRRLNQEQRMQSAPEQKQVWIIVDAHRLTLQAANALLKTLEEPQDGQVIILLAPSIRSVLPTIVSRCQRLIFPGQAEPVFEQSPFEIDQLIQKIQNGRTRDRLAVVEILAKQADSLANTLMHMQNRLMAYLVTPAQAGVQRRSDTWMPASAGMTINSIQAIEKALQALKSHGNTQLVLEELLLKEWPTR